MDDSEKKPFWKLPIMWLVLGLPLASIVAGVGATRHSAASAAIDSVASSDSASMATSWRGPW